VQERGFAGDEEEKEDSTREKGSEGVEMACLKDSRRVVAKPAAAAGTRAVSSLPKCLKEKKQEKEKKEKKDERKV